MAKRTLVLVPAYNEGRRLSAVLAGIHLHMPAADVLVVDDGSKDATSEEAAAAGAFVARHPFNLGYGAALQTGYLFAMERGYDFVIQMDGDGQHDPRDMSAVAEPVVKGEADVSIGSRFLRGGYPSRIGRRIGSWLYSLLASVLTGNRITDSTSGFWAMNRKAVALCAGASFPQDYPDADVLIAMHNAGISIKEVPVRMYPSERGASMHRGLRPLYYVFKMNLSIFLELFRRNRRAS